MAEQSKHSSCIFFFIVFAKCGQRPKQTIKMMVEILFLHFLIHLEAQFDTTEERETTTH